MDALKFVSIADEKVARIFEAPKAFVRLTKHLRITGIDVDEVNPSSLHCSMPITDPPYLQDARPVGATVPPLGLSNKAVSDVTAQSAGSHPAITTRPPYEGELASMTLWPEVEKVFGHGYEVWLFHLQPSFRVAANSIASLF